MTQRCLVLGGGGFIGKHLCQALVEKGYQVRVFERTHPPQLPSTELEWFQGDFTNPMQVEAALKDCDWIFHLVSTTIPQTSNEDPVYDLQSNVVGTLHLLNSIRNNGGVRKVIYLSSGGTVYGIPQSIPIAENHPTNPLSAYGIGKLAIEKYLELYRLLHNINYVALRLANPYGEYQRVHASQGAIPVFMHKALHNEPIDIWGDGSVVRDYVYVGDVVSAILKTMQYQGQQNIFNIGSGRGTSLRELIILLENLLGRTVQRHFLDGRKFDVPANVLDISLAREQLSWMPQTSLLDGMRKVYSYMSSL